MSSEIFGAYDIRGKYPEEIGVQIVRVIARALGKYFKEGNAASRKVILGRDARLSSPLLHKTIKQELKKNKKLKLIDIGLATTPMFFFLTNRLKARGGIMITASHNPKEWNGLKVIGKGGQMLSGREVLRIMKRHEVS